MIQGADLGLADSRRERLAAEIARRARTDLRMRVRALGEVHVAFLVRLHAGVESMTAVRLPQVVVRGRAFLANGALAFDKLEGAGRMRVVAARLEPVAALGHLFDGHSEDCSLR